MMIQFSGGRISGTADVPASKSIAQRAIFMSSMCQTESVIRHVSMSQDITSSIDAVRALGSDVTAENGTIRIKGSEPEQYINIDAGNSGTVLRFAAGVSSLYDCTAVIAGDPSLTKRPMRPLLDALNGLGAECASDGGHAPIKVKGRAEGGKTEIDGGMSSQFVSSLLIAAPLMDRGLELRVTGERRSAPYIEMTLRMMRERGIDVQSTPEGYIVHSGRYRGIDMSVPGDWSSAAFVLAAGALGGSVSVTGLDTGGMQGDAAIADVLRTMGADVRIGGDRVSCKRRGRLKATCIDMGDTPDLFPVTAVLMSTADGDSELYGAPNLRLKESDRIESVVNMLNTLGADAEATDGGCLIHGRDTLRGGTVDHRGDHRVMMAAAVASLCCTEPVHMEDDGCWNVSFPGFPETMAAVGLRCRRCTP